MVWERKKVWKKEDFRTTDEEVWKKKEKVRKTKGIQTWRGKRGGGVEKQKEEVQQKGRSTKNKFKNKRMRFKRKVRHQKKGNKTRVGKTVRKIVFENKVLKKRRSETKEEVWTKNGVRKTKKDEGWNEKREDVRKNREGGGWKGRRAGSTSWTCSYIISEKTRYINRRAVFQFVWTYLQVYRMIISCIFKCDTLSWRI